MPETPNTHDLEALARALDGAADGVIEQWERRPFEVPEPHLLRDELRAVAEAVRVAAEAGAESVSDAQSTVDRGRLLRLLRAELLARWSEERDGSLLLTMRAFHAAEEELSLDEPVGAAEHSLPPFARTVLAEVSHMLRSPLGAIVMLADTLATASEDLEADAYRHRSRIIYRAALGLAALSEDLLTLTSEEDLAETPTEFSLSEVVERVRDLVLLVCAARGTELILHEPEHEKGHRLGRPRILARALLNLAFEAALRTQTGSVEIDVRPGDSDDVVFTVSEPGDGAAVEDLFRIFRRDDESDDYSMSADAIRMVGARHLVRLLGSTLDLREGEDGVQTTFRVALPHT